MKPLLMVGLVWLELASTRVQPQAPSADDLYRQGRLAEADARVRADPAAANSMLACRLALYANRAGAGACLRRLVAASPADRTVQGLLAEASYRAGDYAAAAAAYAASGRDDQAERLRQFGPAGPYLLRRFGREQVIPFVRLDPLPVVTLRVNGGPPRNFIVDTGAGDTIIDPAVAAEAGAKTFGEQKGTFAGGATAGVGVASVDRLTLGGAEIGNVPVAILSTARFGAAFGGLPISGVIGTGLLSRFLGTIDYPHARLVLRPKGAARGARGVSVPMWLMGDHFILVEGRINGQHELAFVDTGLAGLGCTVPRSTFDRIGASAGESRPGGVGGAGDVGPVTPFRATIALGPVSRPDVPCILGPFPPTLETLGGSRIGMLVSHQFLRPFAATFDFTHMKLVLGR